MTRKISLIVCAIQVIVLLSLFSLVSLSAAGTISREGGEPIFKAFGIIFVLMSPFGLLSLFMSIAFQFMARHKLLSMKQQEVLSAGPVIRFFVWEEVRADLGGSA